MKLSILIPVYGQPELARIAILSASRYLGVVEEIQILDDKPSDPLISHCPDILRSSDRIRYEINDVNLGRTGTYNKLLNNCRSDLFLMLDGDDYLADGIDFVDILQAFEKTPDLNIVCGRCREVFRGSEIKTSGPTVRGMVSGFEYLQAWVGAKNLFPHSASIVRRDAAASCLGYPAEILNSDIAMLRNVLLEGKALVVNELISYWRFHGDNASTSSGLNILLKNFDSVLIPYRHGVAKGLCLNPWLYQNTKLYLISAFHQIVGAAHGRELQRYFEFFYHVMRDFAFESRAIFWGAFASLPKIASLICLRQMLGNQKFARMMALRGNYVYISKTSVV